jgi:hypothetical protein
MCLIIRFRLVLYTVPNFFGFSMFIGIYLLARLICVTFTFLCKLLCILFTDEDDGTCPATRAHFHVHSLCYFNMTSHENFLSVTIIHKIKLRF